jgi:hypothetical protein
MATPTLAPARMAGAGLAALEIYDPATDRWTVGTPMPAPTHGLVGGAFVGGRIYLSGGAVTQGGGSGSVIHWVFRPPADCRSGT